MKHAICTIALLSSALALAEVLPYRNAALPVETRVGDLLSRMTPVEKVGQLVMTHTASPTVEKPVLEAFAAGRAGSVIWQREDPRLHDEYQRAALSSRLGIPVLFCQDVIHGMRTIFPIAPTLASAFEPELFARTQAVAAREARMNGIDLVFAPMCDIACDPRWGRVAETCGEDPYLASLCVAAQVRGFQGDDPSQPDRVVSCLKHFCGYGASEGGRDYTTAELGDWMLRNRHLPPFEAGVVAGARMVMSSFNTLDGVPMAANGRLLNDILRGEWGFDGAVVSDWAAVEELISWGYASDRTNATVKALLAGNDIDMCTECFDVSLKGLVDAGRIPMAKLDEAVRRVLRVKFASGVFEHPFTNAKSQDEYWESLARSSNAAWPLAVECVEKSAVLLENNGVLPLKPETLTRVAVIGPLATDRFQANGCWVFSWNPGARTTLAESLATALGSNVVVTAETACDVFDGKKAVVRQDGTISEAQAPADGAMDETFEKGIARAAEADLVILALGEYIGWTGENASRNDLSLTGRQQELFDRVAALGKPIVTVLFSGHPLVLPEVWSKSDALLFVGQPGNAFAEGLANLLVGKTSPSGRLSMSVPDAVGNAPVVYNCFSGGRPGKGLYREYSRKWGWDALPREKLVGREKYVFGYGLTYGDFTYGKPEVKNAANGDARVVATVANRGQRTATETVQLYVSQVACDAGVRPIRELRGFRRVTLAPGASASVEFALDDATLGYVTRAGEKRCDAGRYRVKIAPDAARGEWIEFEKR